SAARGPASSRPHKKRIAPSITETAIIGRRASHIVRSGPFDWMSFAPRARSLPGSNGSVTRAPLIHNGSALNSFSSGGCCRFSHTERFCRYETPAAMSPVSSNVGLFSPLAAIICRTKTASRTAGRNPGNVPPGSGLPGGLSWSFDEAPACLVCARRTVSPGSGRVRQWIRRRPRGRHSRPTPGYPRARGVRGESRPHFHPHLLVAVWRERLVSTVHYDLLSVQLRRARWWRKRGRISGGEFAAPLRQCDVGVGAGAAARSGRD